MPRPAGEAQRSADGRFVPTRRTETRAPANDDLAKLACLAGRGYFRARNFLDASRSGDLWQSKVISEAATGLVQLSNFQN